MALITTKIVIKKEVEIHSTTSYDWEYNIYKRYNFLNWFKFDWFIVCGSDELSAINFVKRMKGPRVAWEKIID